jgi:transposase
MPGRRGNWKTAYHRFRLLVNFDVFGQAFRDLAAARCDSRPRLPLLADCTFVKNAYGQDVLGRNPTDRGRKASKISLLCDTGWAPLHIELHRANENDCTTLERLLDSAATNLRRPLASHHTLYADKGYDTRTCRAACQRHGLVDHIPHRGQPTPPGGIRCRVEHVFARLDKFRRLLYRYEVRSNTVLAFHYFAMANMHAFLF